MIEMKKFSFTYGGAKKPVLHDIDLEVQDGEFVVVVGLSGSGKSTLCRALNGLIPHFYGGKVHGHVKVDGHDTRNTPPAKLASIVGMVFQDPENQLVMTNVENELAFGMENIQLPREQMKARVKEYSNYFDLERFFKRFIPELSGGEKQKVALASVLAMQPRYIVLDEPTSQLDEETASLFLGFLERVSREQGITVVLVEHRLERCLHRADRIVLLEGGRVESQGPPSKMVPLMRQKGLMADMERVASEVCLGEPVLSVQDLHFSYGDVPILKGLDLEVKKGELVAIIGANGSGKSTLLKQLNGILRPSKGNVTLFGKDIANATTASIARDIGYLGQNPNNYLFEESLVKELEFTLHNLKVPKEDWPERSEWAMRTLDLERYKGTFPRDLSCGERERAALASVLVGRPKLLVLDEPTRGLDHSNKLKLANIMHSLCESEMSAVIVTHDYRFVAEHATRVLALKDGKLEPIEIDEVKMLARQVECTEA